MPSWSYRAAAIQSWGSRRTKRFAKGKRGLSPDQIEGKIERLLEHLGRGAPLDALESVGCQIHRLKGDRKGTYAIAVSGSHRIVFRLGEDENGAAIVLRCRNDRLPQELERTPPCIPTPAPMPTPLQA